MQEGVPYPVSFNDCLESIKLLNAFYQSDETGDWKNVNEPGESFRLGKVDESISELYRSFNK